MQSAKYHIRTTQVGAGNRLSRKHRMGALARTARRGGADMRVVARLPAVFFVLLTFMLSLSPAWAVDDREILFLGHPILPRAGTYLVTKDVTIRDVPDTDGKKVGSFEAGDRVQIVGRAKGSWMAVRDEKKDLGFLYALVLTPLLSDAAKAPLSGTAQFTGGACGYKIIYDGDTAIEGQEFNSFDYHVNFECRYEDRTFSFKAPMFISEGPYNSGRNPVHQIGIDVLELAQDYDQFFSTNLLYDRDKGQVRFDSSNVKKYKAKKIPDPLPATTGAEALTAGIALGLRSWSAEFWKDLAEALKTPSAR